MIYLRVRLVYEYIFYLMTRQMQIFQLHAASLFLEHHLVGSQQSLRIIIVLALNCKLSIRSASWT